MSITWCPLLLDRSWIPGSQHDVNNCGLQSLRRAIVAFMAHYHEERNHQGLDNALIRAGPVLAANDSVIQRRPRLGGMLNYYDGAAA